MRKERRLKYGDEYSGDILSVRAVEDSIRATQKYTEGIRTMRAKHPIQGEEFPGRAFCKYYEVYPDVNVSNMSLGTVFEWLTGYKTHIDVTFNYDYRTGKAAVTVADGKKAVQELTKAIPGFSDALDRVVAGGNGNTV